jgi:hypothetical protein
VTLRRHGVATLHENPHAAQVDAVDAVFQLADFSAELRRVPRKHRGRIGASKVKVMHAELRSILHDLYASPPRIFDEGERKQAGHVSRGRDDLHAIRFKHLHRRIEVRNRKSDVIDRASLAREGLLSLREDDAHLIQ